MGTMALSQIGAYHKRNRRWPLAWKGAGFIQVSLAERCESAIRHLLNTPLGSLYVAPDYGTLFYLLRTQSFPHFVLSQDGQDHLSVAVAHMRQATAKYIPDVLIKDVAVEPNTDEEVLKLGCLWVIRNANAKMHGDLATPRSTNVLI